MIPVQSDDSSQGEGDRSPRSLAEWVTFGLASLILATIVGLVIFSWAIEKQRPPAFKVTRPEAIREENGQFYIPFEVVNTGGAAAESVQVMAELQENGEVEETGDLQIDFLASGEKQSGAFVFSKDPRRSQLTVRVSAYKEP